MAINLTANALPHSYHDFRVTTTARALAADIGVERAAAAVTDDILAEVWPGVEDPAFLAALGRSLHDELRAIFDLLAGRADLAVVPETALEFADAAAHLGIPDSEIHRAYRVLFVSLWSRWCSAARALGGDVAMFDELIDDPTRVIHAYVDDVVEAVVARHGQVYAELHQTRREHRRRLLTQILDGSIDETTEELDRELGYSLADTHLALLIDDDHGSPSAADIAALRDVVDARGSLLVEHTARTWVVWLGRPGGFESVHLERLLALLAATGLTVAVGEPGEGLPGLRRTRQHALDAARVQRALGVDKRRCLWAREVRLEMLLLADRERAREFVADELAPLSASDPFTRRLRETLLAWLTTGSYNGAAACLGVHENTVRNRLRAAQELLGVSLVRRRTELVVALRLERVLRSVSGESPSS